MHRYFTFLYPIGIDYAWIYCYVLKLWYTSNRFMKSFCNIFLRRIMFISNRPCILLIYYPKLWLSCVSTGWFLKVQKKTHMFIKYYTAYNRYWIILNFNIGNFVSVQILIFKSRPGTFRIKVQRSIFKEVHLHFYWRHFFRNLNTR